MASILKKWLWLGLMGATGLLVLTVHTRSRWVLALILVPGAVGLGMRLREIYIHDLRLVKKRRGDA